MRAAKPSRTGGLAPMLGRKGAPMIQTLGHLLPYALPVALSPLPVIAALMLVLSPPGPRGGMAFLAGRLLALGLATALAAGLAETLQDRAGADVPRVWLRLGLGLALAALALRSLLRPAPADAPLPGWLAALETATPAAALRLGALVTLANPKELAFLLAAGLAIGAQMPGLPALIALALAFALLAGSGVALPVLAALIGGPTMRLRLVPLRDSLVARRGIVMGLVLAFIAALLIGDAIGSLGS